MSNSVTPRGVEHEQGRGSTPLALTPYHPVSHLRMDSGIPIWLRIWAVMTACAALPLVTLGAEVTTKRVGMVDPKGFRMPWHLFTMSSDQLSVGYLIEHGHRLAGYIVGFACIVLALGLTLQGRDWLHRGLGWFALVMVSLQGMLGIFRVDLNAVMGSSLALVHGCFAQLVFATLVSVAVFCSAPGTSQRCRLPTHQGSGRSVCVCWYMSRSFLAQHFATSSIRWRSVCMFCSPSPCSWPSSGWRPGSMPRKKIGPTRRVAYLLVGLVVLQPILGVEAWIRALRYQRIA